MSTPGYPPPPGDPYGQQPPAYPVPSGPPGPPGSPPPGYPPQGYGQPDYQQPDYQQPGYPQPGDPYGQPVSGGYPPGPYQPPTSGGPYPGQPPTSGGPYPGQPPTSGAPYPGQPQYPATGPMPADPGAPPGYGYPAAPGSPGAPGYPDYPATLGFPGAPAPAAPPRRKRGLKITLIVLAIVLVLCGGGGIGAYLLLRNVDGAGQPSPTAATDAFLTAVYKDKDVTKASKYVCSAARNTDTLTKKVNEIKAYEEKYRSPSYTWAPPTVESQNKDTAKLTVAVKFSSADDRAAEQKLRITAINNNGWWVCDVQTFG